MRPCLMILLLSVLTGCSSSHVVPPGGVSAAQVEELRASLRAGAVTFDLYLPASIEPAPLVVVAHGFLRTKSNMAGWGQRLAGEGFVAAVPTLPTWSDHARNGRAIGELVTWLSGSSLYARRIDRQQIGLMGFSAGGLSTLLAAADQPNVRIWVGLDPVDRDGMGLAALPRIQARPVILRAEPSAWNAQGNARALIAAFGPRCETALISGAIHIDAEWPTDVWAELACGKSSDDRRNAFAAQAISALNTTLRPPRS